MTTKMGVIGVVNSKGNSGEDRLVLGSGWKNSPPPDPLSISEECLSVAEEAAEQMLNCVHPTQDSEERRRDVIDYVQQLLKSHLNCEVVSYGSVPLKTYLPDGDIDLTVLKGPNAEESLAHDVLALLQNEERNENAEFQVRDTQFIDAEVKLVKCIVRNIVVDISFNQLGGLSTLCFLEQVDRLVGRNHLFKRSIILVKTWCYYESRILGAHHGLISTYALETLVLYIFHIFHSSLAGPLTVLYRFLDYFSRFDWENHCVSLKGPVCKSSLPDKVVKMPESVWNAPLLSEQFLENCMELFSVPSRGLEANPKAFQPKHLNIIDPLKESNNLGRSVHRGNFYRIRSAFKYGAHKLGQVLLQPRDEVADEIYKFFANTRARHEHQYRSSIRHLAIEFDDDESLTGFLSSPADLYSEDDMLLKSSVSDYDDNSVGVEQEPILEFRNELDRCSIREVSPEMASEACSSADGIVSGHTIDGGKHAHAASNFSLRNGTADYVSNSNYSSSLSEIHFHKPHYFYSKTFENGSSSKQIDSTCDSESFGFNTWLDNREKHAEMNNTYGWCTDNSDSVCRTDSSTPKASILETLSIDFRDLDSLSIGGESEAFNPLADLSGDYDSNIRSLLRGQLCHGFASSATVGSNTPSLPSRIQNKKPWDVVRQSMPLIRQSELSQINSHAITAEPHIMYPTVESGLLGTAFHFEGIQKARGTGTYFPHMNAFYMERSSQGRGRYKTSGNHNYSHQFGHGNGFYPGGESNSFEVATHEVLPARKKYQGRRRRFDVTPQSNGDGHQNNGYSSESRRIEFGSIGNLAEEVISASAHDRGLILGGASFKQQGSMMRERDTSQSSNGCEAVQSIHLKNEDEFPPLCQ